MSEFNTEETKEILFPEEEELNRLASENFSEQLRNEFAYKRIESNAKINPELLEVANEHKIYTELAEFIREHIKSVGQEQAIKDFQTGLNLLTGYKKETVLEEQIRLEEDADFGDKTFAMLQSALEYYPLEVIKKYIQKGASNNAVWETKDETEIDTNEYVDEVAENLTEEEK